MTSNFPSNYALKFCVVTDPDFTGFRFYVEAGDVFDADVYAEAYNLHVSADIDAQDVHSAQDAASRLNTGEWLLVEHEVREL